jgi:hypothetical protein
MSLCALVPYNTSGTVVLSLPDLVVSGGCLCHWVSLHVCACVSQYTLPLLTYQYQVQ